MKYPRGTSLEEYCNAEHLNWLLEQFDYDKNYPNTPKEFTKSSDEKIWFKYICGHSCRQRIADKTGKNSKGCPYCLNRGEIGRSLRSEYPSYADMFLEDKNGILANRISYMNGNPFLWRCNRCGNVFKGKVSDVVSRKRVCDVCANKKRSYPEICLDFYFTKGGIEREVNKCIDGYRFDFYLPQYKLVIEYDGYPWHQLNKAKENDAIKDKICKKNNIFIMRVRDGRNEKNNNLSAKVWEFEYDDNLNFMKRFPEKLKELLEIDLMGLDIDIKRDLKLIGGFEVESNKKESLLVHMPEITKFLDCDKRNGNPAYVSNASHKIRFWLKDPEFQKLKWSMTAHDLFAKKTPYTQKIRMCKKVLEKYPEIEEQVFAVKDKINENSSFELTCKCGVKFQKKYAALMGKRKVEMCNECLKQFRVRNIRRVWMEQL